MSFFEIAKYNENQIKNNPYPGRGIIIGMTPDKKNMVQVYWIMGRSENSRNRIFKKEGLFLRTKAFDETKLADPSLIIYYPVKHFENAHIVTNGDQTDTIYEDLKNGGSFESALFKREFEPDSPNYTPRISGIIELDNPSISYKLSILKSANNNPSYSQKMFFNYESAIPGFGHCIHTYDNDGNPIPSFTGEPRLVSLQNNAEENLNYYWNLLNEDNRVSILVKYINIETGEASIEVINKNK